MSERKRIPAVDIEKVFHALGDPTRRGMVERLSAAPMSVSALAAPLDMTLTAVMQHLQVLEESGLIVSEKVGRVRSCQLDPSGFAALERWTRDRHSVWERRLDKLADVLREE